MKGCWERGRDGQLRGCGWAVCIPLDEKEEAGPRLSGWLPGPGQQRLRQHQEAPADVGGQSPWPPWWTQSGRQSSSGSRGLR